MTQKIEESFQHIPRKDFVPEEYLAEAEGDYPLPIGAGQTISQPFTVRFMLNLLDVEEGEHVLDVGSGSGWTTALLAYLVGNKGDVMGVERVPGLVALGQANLAKYKFPNARIEQASAELGSPAGAPYDRILVSASASELPKGLVDQLAVGGTMVIPINNAIEKIIKEKGGGLTREHYDGFVFVPLIQDAS